MNFDFAFDTSFENLNFRKYRVVNTIQTYICQLFYNKLDVKGGESVKGAFNIL